MFYFVRCICGTNLTVFSFRGALRQLKHSGPEAGVYSMTGKWIAGRVQGAAA